MGEHEIHDRQLSLPADGVCCHPCRRQNGDAQNYRYDMNQTHAAFLASMVILCENIVLKAMLAHQAVIVV